MPRGEPAIARHRLDGPSFELAGLSRARSLRILGRSARENGGERESVPGTFAPGRHHRNFTFSRAPEAVRLA
jgi:hypothetical protein